MNARVVSHAFDIFAFRRSINREFLTYEFLQARQNKIENADLWHTSEERPEFKCRNFGNAQGTD